MQAKGYDHPASQLGLPRLASQKDKLQALQTEDWDFLIQAHLRLGCTIAGIYHMGGGDSDEMVSAAWEGIVVAVDRIKNGHLSHKNITGYICKYIYEYCARARRLDSLVPHPRAQESKMHQLHLTDPGCAPDDFAIVDLLNELDVLTRNSIEREIVSLRMEGYTDDEISLRLRVCRSTVTSIRRKLHERYKR